jgi:hypothetical protein
MVSVEMIADVTVNDLIQVSLTDQECSILRWAD